MTQAPDMRIAIVSDIHGNLTAFNAILADLRHTSPDLILHGGDLADAGSSPVEIVDHIDDLRWPGVVGNTDQMLFDPESLAKFAKQSPAIEPFLKAIEEMAEWTREELGAERLAWLNRLPKHQIHPPLALVHASPETPWHCPQPEASDDELQSAYQPLGQPLAVYAHTHRSFIRVLPELTIINTGSVNLSYDGDPRAAYLLIDGLKPEIRRIEYDLNREVTALSASGLPYSSWITKILKSGRPQLP